MKYIKQAYGKAKSVTSGSVIPYAKKHKVISGIAIMALLFGSYQLAQAMFGAGAETRYVLARATTGELKNTIIGTGQVSASNQIDLSAKASGSIVRINAVVGQEMRQGEIIAQIDTRDIAMSLESARLSLQKVTKPADALTVSQARYAIDDARLAKSKAEIELAKAYEDGLTAVSNSFIDLPAIITGMNDLFYTREGFLSDSNPSTVIASAATYKNSAGVQFDVASNDYKAVQNTYRQTARSGATSTTEKLIEETHAAISKLSESLKNSALAVDYVRTRSNGQAVADATTALNNINGWISKNNSHLNGLMSARTAIENAKNTIVTSERNIREKTDSLNDILAGADPLDVRSQQLSVRQRELEYENYIVRAPFDGVLAQLTAKVGNSSSGGIGTFITKQKIAEITLNEIDASKVQAGQAVELTFDAVDDVTATGTIASIDLVGTVSQGVVSYKTQIAFDAPDDRIKPGMSVTATITTQSKQNVLLVPAGAVKTRGNSSYVEVAAVDMPSIPANAGSPSQRGARMVPAAGQSTSSTSTVEDARMNRTSSSARPQGNFMTMGTGGITLPAQPEERTVTVGDSNDAYVEITSGLDEGEFVVTRTTGGAAGATGQTANSATSLFGGARTGAGGAARATGGAGAGATFIRR